MGHPGETDEEFRALRFREKWPSSIGSRRFAIPTKRARTLRCTRRQSARENCRHALPQTQRCSAPSRAKIEARRKDGARPDRRRARIRSWGDAGRARESTGKWPFGRRGTPGTLRRVKSANSDYDLVGAHRGDQPKFAVFWRGRPAIRGPGAARGLRVVPASALNPERKSALATRPWPTIVRAS